MKRNLIQLAKTDRIARYVLDHGQKFRTCKTSCLGAEVPGFCYNNARQWARDEALYYAEGYVWCEGELIRHAFCVNAEGVVVDPSLDTGLGEWYWGIIIPLEDLPSDGWDLDEEEDSGGSISYLDNLLGRTQEELEAEGREWRRRRGIK